MSTKPKDAWKTNKHLHQIPILIPSPFFFQLEQLFFFFTTQLPLQIFYIKSGLAFFYANKDKFITKSNCDIPVLALARKNKTKMSKVNK